MNRLFLFFLMALILVACKEEQVLNEQQVIDKAIEAAGGTSYNDLQLNFDFRGKHYQVKRDNGSYAYKRIWTDSIGKIADIVTNTGFERMINEEAVQVPDSMASKYTSSINSVQYFTLLPFGLNDTAVNKELLENEEIKETNYHRVQVTFDQEGGGEDFEDVFIYWINSETYKVDFLAYSYNEDDGVGMRFREAYNERYIGNIRFVDYNNYKAETNDVKLTDLGKLFDSGKLKLLSKIENTNISVK